jgi:hypothetical protein
MCPVTRGNSAGLLAMDISQFTILPMLAKSVVGFRKYHFTLAHYVRCAFTAATAGGCNFFPADRVSPSHGR